MKEEQKRKKITEKVKKLLEMASNGTPNEQRIALVKAQKLMLDHHILENDLKNFMKEEIVSLRVDPKVNCYSSWCMRLSEIITDNFRCIPLYSHLYKCKGKKEQCSVFGYESDAAICKEVMEAAYDQITKQVKITVNYYYRNYGSTKGVKEDYIQGFLDGLKEEYYEQVLSQNRYALVITVPEEVKTEEKKRYTSRSIKIKVIIPANNRDVQLFGYREGKEFAQGIKTKKLNNKQRKLTKKRKLIKIVLDGKVDM